MAQKTQLAAGGTAGQVQAFSPKTAFVAAAPAFVQADDVIDLPYTRIVSLGYEQGIRLPYQHSVKLRRRR